MYTDKKYIVYENDTPIIWCQSTVDAWTLAELLNSLTERITALEAENAQLKRERDRAERAFRKANAMKKHEHENSEFWREQLRQVAHVLEGANMWTEGTTIARAVRVLVESVQTNVAERNNARAAVDVNPALPQEEA